ncbi:MAG TPA: uroporphyrinogen decarboxylase family protein [Phycisphaerae bacterium]|nr:uroporphyrinogen decarboxylase family protein [Phycisphaerae bacterium]
MNSTQRLLAAMRGEAPDRVPVSTYELVGWNPAAWENDEPSYRRLMDFAREHTDCMYMCGVPVPNVREGQIDRTVETWDEGDQHFTRTVTHAPTRKLTKVTSRSDHIHTVWVREHPCKDLDDMRAYLDLPWEAGEPDFSHLERAWADLGDDRGLPLVSVGDPICELSEVFDLGDFLVLAMTETGEMVKALDRLHERYLERLRRQLTGPVRNVVFRICGPEYATPPYLPPELFRRFVTRYDGRYVEMIRAAGGIPRIHCHGKTARVVDQIAEMAPEALDPLEPPPDGDISVAELKAAVGGRICLTGGIELKHLEHADGEFMERLVRDTIEAGKPGGRFIIMPTAAPINVPLSPKTEANYFRFIETALDAGRY